MKRPTGRMAGVLLGLGVLLILGAALLTADKTGRQIRAAERSAALYERLAQLIPETPSSTAPVIGAKTSPGELGTLVVDGVRCAGILSLPQSRMSWPVGSVGGDVRFLPCLTEEEDILTVLGASSAGQFSAIATAAEGDEVIFTDVRGNRYRYEVTAIFRGEGEMREERNAGMIRLICQQGTKRITIDAVSG